MTDETQRSLGRLEGKLDLILETIKADREAHREKNVSLDTRVRAVENDISSVKTTSGLIASGSAFLVSLAATVLPNVFHK